MGVEVTRRIVGPYRRIVTQTGTTPPIITAIVRMREITTYRPNDVDNNNSLEFSGMNE